MNALPGTVSSAGIIDVSETDLDWGPVREAWVNHQTLLRSLIVQWIGASTHTDPGPCFDLLQHDTSEIMKEGRVGWILTLTQLFEGLTEGADSSFIGSNAKALERIFLYCPCRSVGGLLEAEDRMQFEAWLCKRDVAKGIESYGGETI